jgi:hypothetical protein
MSSIACRLFDALLSCLEGSVLFVQAGKRGGHFIGLALFGNVDSWRRNSIHAVIGFC